jgi:hypothetical protein
MAELIEAYAGPQEPAMSNAELDADAIKDTPYQGALPAAEHSSGIRFSHENADAWKLLLTQMSSEEYEALRNAVIEKVGEFEEKTPQAGDSNE